MRPLCSVGEASGILEHAAPSYTLLNDGGTPHTPKEVLPPPALS